MNLKSMLLIFAGCVFLALGVVGLLLPILPTTPFVLCSVGCFAGSPRLRSAVMKIGFIRQYYENYQNRYGLPKRTVLFSLLFLWGMLTISCILTQKLWLTMLLAAVGITVTIHILCIARRRSGSQQHQDNSDISKQKKQK